MFDIENDFIENSIIAAIFLWMGGGKGGEAMIKLKID